jgi:hypothetical protein
MKIEDPLPSFLLNEIAELRHETELMRLRERWFKIIEDFSSRNLTFELDKLPALSGLVQESMKMHGSYYAGLWEKDMPSALLWRTRNEIYVPEKKLPRRPSQYRAPTWSWASVEGDVTYESQMLDHGGARDSSRKADCDFGKFQVRGTAEGQNISGAVSEGNICLSGSLKVATLNTNVPEVTGSPHHRGWNALSKVDGATIGAIYIDVLSELGHGQAIFCLGVRNERYWSMISLPDEVYGRGPEPEDDEESRALIMGLALLDDEKHPGAYRRVGLVRLDEAIVLLGH